MSTPACIRCLLQTYTDGQGRAAGSVPPAHGFWHGFGAALADFG